MQSVAIAVAKLQGDHEWEKRTKMKKVLMGASQTLRADKIREELDGYVKSLTWYMDSFTVCVGSYAIRLGTLY